MFQYNVLDRSRESFHAIPVLFVYRVVSGENRIAAVMRLTTTGKHYFIKTEHYDDDKDMWIELSECVNITKDAYSEALAKLPIKLRAKTPYS